MFNLSPDLMFHFLDGWTEDNEGFELSWRELEICRMAIVPASVGEIRDKLREKYAAFDDIQQSTFYRIVERLIGNGNEPGYLREVEVGRSKIVQITPLGLKELGRVNRYILEMQIENTKDVLFAEVVENAMPYLQCILDGSKTVLALGPEYRAVKTIARAARNCRKHKSDTHKTDPEELLNHIIFLNYGADMEGKEDKSRTIDIKLDDWPFKDNYADVVFEFTGLNSFKDTGLADDLLREAIRVTKPGGIIVIFEVNKETSRIANFLVHEVTQLMQSSTPEDIKWVMPDELIERSEIEAILAKYEDRVTISEFLPDIINTKVILTKK